MYKSIFSIFVVVLLTSCASKEQFHKYEFVKEIVTWEEAKRKAEEAGGQLASIETADEYDYIISQEGYEKQTWWLGLTDVDVEGEWVWLSGKKLNSWFVGKLNKGRDLDERDYGHLAVGGTYWARAESGALPARVKGRPLVEGYIIEFD